MSLQFQVEAGGSTVPAGLYRARFVTVEATEHDEYGDGLRFVFEVVEGEHAKEQATRITGAKPTPKNAAGRMIAGITGQTLKVGATIDLDPFVGKEYLVQVEATKNDSTRIGTVLPANV